MAREVRQSVFPVSVPDSQVRLVLFRSRGQQSLFFSRDARVAEDSILLWSYAIHGNLVFQLAGTSAGPWKQWRRRPDGLKVRLSRLEELGWADWCRLGEPIVEFWYII